MRTTTSILGRILCIEVIVIALGSMPRGDGVQRADPVDPEASDGEEGSAAGRCVFRDRDFYVSHVSTLPANAGRRVRLFVRERGNSCGPPVLMLGGASQPAMVTFDLPYRTRAPHAPDDYSWMNYLASAGFDVFAMDLQGYGFSTRPEVMNCPCNAAHATQTSLLVPTPLTQACEPGIHEPCGPFTGPFPYSFFLTNNPAEWDQIDAVVDTILAARHRERVSLVGWSQGGARAGGYASEHPEKVDRLFLYAPWYRRADPARLPVPTPPGPPLAITAVSAFLGRWDKQVTCPNQFDPRIRDQLTASLLHFDPLGATWGSQPLWRSPYIDQTSGAPLTSGPGYFGWNHAAAAKLHMPILLIRGDNDTQVRLEQVTDLFSDVSSESKVFVHVACGAHQLVWETQHVRLLDASVQWLKEGRYAGERNGCFAVDVNGIATPDPHIAAACPPMTGDRR